MNNSNFNMYFRKYSILLIIFYIIELLVSKYQVLPIEPEYNIFVYLSFYFLYNMFLAVLISTDLKNLNIKSNLTVIAVIFFNLFGVCFFLLNVIDKDRKENINART